MRSNPSRYGLNYWAYLKALLLGHRVKTQYLTIIITSLLAIACGESSELNYARQIEDKNSLMCHVESSEIEKQDHKRLEVCVDNMEAKFISSKSVLLEAKLAIFHWLEVAGHKKSHRLFTNMNFTQNCGASPQDGQKRLRVIIPSQSQIKSNSKFNSYFIKPKSRCRYKNSKVLCKLSAFVFGFAEQFGKASMINDADKPDTEARVVFNPNIDWAVLGDELADMGHEILASDYQTLLEDSSDYNDVIYFIRKLQSKKLIARGERSSADTISMAKRLKSYFRTPDHPQLGMYSIMMHEMGHVFGLGHADQPGRRYVTGDAHGNESVRNVHKTKSSVMAYDKKYIHLTDDDRAGIRAILKNL